MSDSILVLAPEPIPSLMEDANEVVRRIVGNDLIIESVEVPRDPKQGVLVVRGRLTVPSHIAFRRWLAELRPVGFTPTLRYASSAGDASVALSVYAGIPKITRSRPWINILLFLLTIVCTLFFGFIYSGDVNGVARASDLLRPRYLLQGWPFSATLLSILVAHEFGHYFAARFHKVAVSLPYFIPLPPIPPDFFTLGTLGAFIRLKEPVPDRRKLFDIGVAGPLAGLVLAIPLLIFGLATSAVEIPPAGGSQLLEGNSILYWLAKLIVFGKVLPNTITGEDIFMNQVTFAAWFGLFITSLNLLPVGQLDGGHTVYGIFGRAARYINLATLGVMGVLALAGIPYLQTLWPVLEKIGFLGWWLWLALIIFLIGPYHPPALDDVTQLDGRRRLIGYLVIILFILTFVPTPFRLL
jgi:membrane-associated protease RseP (regulator of RpoE activity)